MSDRTLWIVRVAAILVFLLLAYVMLDLYARLRKMNEERRRADVRLQIAPAPPPQAASRPGSSSRAA